MAPYVGKRPVSRRPSTAPGSGTPSASAVPPPLAGLGGNETEGRGPLPPPSAPDPGPQQMSLVLYQQKAPGPWVLPLPQDFSTQSSRLSPENVTSSLRSTHSAISDHPSRPREGISVSRRPVFRKRQTKVTLQMKLAHQGQWGPAGWWAWGRALSHSLAHQATLPRTRPLLIGSQALAWPQPHSLAQPCVPGCPGHDAPLMAVSRVRTRWKSVLKYRDSGIEN